VRANIRDCNGFAISEPAADFLGRCTALILATWVGHALVVKQLIAAGAGLDLKENNGYGPIYPSATAVRYIQAGSRFVGRGTALIVAAGEGHALMVKQLIAAGAGLDLKENNGYGPIYPSATAVRYLRAGSRFVGRGPALIVAAGEGHALMVKQLIAAGAGLDLKENNGYGPIYPSATAVRYPSRQPIRG
jgi:ankyrin repeat protein